MRPTVLMLLGNSFTNDARVAKEAASLAGSGLQVEILAVAGEGLPRRQTLEGIEVVRIAARPLRALARALGWRREAASSLPRRDKRPPAPGELRRWLRATGAAIDTFAFALCALWQARRGARPAVVHAHDIDMLFPGWLVARALRARLVYDSHELHVFSVGMLGERPRAWRALACRAERFFARGADRVITVNDACAAALARIHRIPRPLVVRNCPRLADSQRAATGGLRAALGARSGERLAVYCGGLAPHRGIEQAISALAVAAGVNLALLGYGAPTYLESLRHHASAEGVADRVFFVPAVPPAQVSATMRDADLSLVLIQDAGLNYRYSTPNKLFESMHAGLPVVGADLPEIRRVILAHDCGLVVDARDPAAIAGAMSRITQDPSLRARFSAGALAAARELNWENEERALLRAYASLTAPRDTA